MQTKTRTPLKIDTTPPGQLVVQKWNEISTRTKIIALAGILGGSTVLTVLFQAGMTSTRAIAPSNPRADVNYVVQPPMAGLTPNADPQTVVAHLQQELPGYEAYMVDMGDEVLAVLVNQEAMRLYEAARKEAAEGTYTPVDPTSTLDLANCPVRLDIWRCALLRYATEGLAMIARGLETDNAMLYSNGRIRFTAAMLAQYPIPVEAADRSAVLHAHRNYLEGIHELLRLFPSGKAPFTVRTPVSPTQNSPLENIQQNNPSEVQ